MSCIDSRPPVPPSPTMLLGVYKHAKTTKETVTKDGFQDWLSKREWPKGWTETVQGNGNKPRRLTIHNASDGFAIRTLTYVRCTGDEVGFDLWGETLEIHRFTHIGPVNPLLTAPQPGIGRPRTRPDTPYNSRRRAASLVADRLRKSNPSNSRNLP